MCTGRYYESNLIASQAARRVLGCGEPIQAAYGPPDLWNRRQDTGRSMAEIFLQQGLVLQRAENQRIERVDGCERMAPPKGRRAGHPDI